MKYWLIALLALAATSLKAQSNLQTLVELTDRGSSTFYVDVRMIGAGLKQFLVDTGSSYTAINEKTLAELVESNQAAYVKDLEGILADGSKHIVPVYDIKSLSVGDSCTLNEVRAAVFPGGARNILGLSALRAAAPFTFSFDPPTLALSNCAPNPGAPANADLPVAAGAP